MLKKGAVGTRRRLKKWDLKKDKESVLEAERLFNVAQHAAHALNTAFAQVPGGPGEFRNAPGLHGIESLPDGISLDGVGKELRFLRADRKIFIEHKDARGLELGEFGGGLPLGAAFFGASPVRGGFTFEKPSAFVRREQRPLSGRTMILPPTIMRMAIFSPAAFFAMTSTRCLAA